MTTHDPYAEIKDLVEVTYQNAPNRPLNYHPENVPIFNEGGTLYWDIPLSPEVEALGLDTPELYPKVDSSELFDTHHEFDYWFNSWPTEDGIRQLLVETWGTEDGEYIVPYFDFLLEHHRPEFDKLMESIPETMWDAYEIATDCDFPPFVSLEKQTTDRYYHLIWAPSAKVIKEEGKHQFGFHATNLIENIMSDYDEVEELLTSNLSSTEMILRHYPASLIAFVKHQREKEGLTS